MSRAVSSSSGIVEESAAVHAARLARKKDTALGNISMSPEVSASSGVVEEPAAVHAASLAQLAAR